MTDHVRDYPAVQFITYAYDDPDEAPVLDVSRNLRAARRECRDRGGVIYRVEKLPESEWVDGVPAYGNETFVEALK